MFDKLRELLDNNKKSDLPNGLAAFDAIVDRRIVETGWRLGQASFNVLDLLYPKWAEEIRTTDKDPYYVAEKADENYVKFRLYLEQKFQELDASIAERNKEPIPNISWEPQTKDGDQDGD